MEDIDLSYTRCKGFRVDGTTQTRVTLVRTKGFNAQP